jgi:hypothetical protein
MVNMKKDDEKSKKALHPPSKTAARFAPYTREILSPSTFQSQIGNFSIESILNMPNATPSALDPSEMVQRSPGNTLHQRAARSNELPEHKPFIRHVRLDSSTSQHCRTDNTDSFSTSFADDRSGNSSPSSGISRSRDVRGSRGSFAAQQQQYGQQIDGTSWAQSLANVQRLHIFKTVRNHANVSIHRCEDKVTGYRVVMKVLRKSRTINGVAHEFAIQARLQVTYIVTTSLF